jgi:hypothetical protein
MKIYEWFYTSITVENRKAMKNLTEIKYKHIISKKKKILACLALPFEHGPHITP